MRRPAVTLWFLLASTSLASPARADAPPRAYGEAVRPEPRSALAAAVEKLARAISARHLGPRREATPASLEIDARLEAALDRIAARLPASGPPAVTSTERALWLSGIVEPTPYLMTMVVPAGADADVMEQMEKLLPPVLAQGRYRRVAVSTVPWTTSAPDSPPGAVRLALAMQESFIEMQTVPRRLSPSGNAALVGRVLAPYDKPVFYVAAPEGNVVRLAPEKIDGRNFRATFRCGGAPGVYQVEVLAEDRLGESVLANFPIYCGVAAPVELELAAEPERAGPRPDAPVDEVRASVEAEVLALVARDRAAAHLPALVTDARLAAVARAYSAEMRDMGFFGHISPASGSALDRLRRAGLDPMRVRENLGRAWSARELEQGLMDSPSHRGNLLADDVERVGIGVAVGEAIGPSGTRDLFLTQLFAHLAEPFSPSRTERELRARVLAIRVEARTPPLGWDAALDGVAAEVARALAAGGADTGNSVSDPVDKAMPALARRWKWLRRVSALALEVAQLGGTPALVDREATHAGIAVAQAKDGIVLVVLMAAKR